MYIRRQLLRLPGFGAEAVRRGDNMWALHSPTNNIGMIEIRRVASEQVWKEGSVGPLMEVWKEESLKGQREAMRELIRLIEVWRVVSEHVVWEDI